MATIVFELSLLLITQMARHR